MWLRSWLQSPNVWKRLSVRYLFIFVALLLVRPTLDLLLPPHRVRWEFGHWMLFSLVVAVITEFLQSVTPTSQSPNDPEFDPEDKAEASRTTRIPSK